MPWSGELNPLPEWRKKRGVLRNKRTGGRICFRVEADMFSYRKASFSNLVCAPPVERAVEFSPPGMDAASVARVLTLAADGKTVSAEAGDGFAEVAGRVNFRLVYTDREGRPSGADYNADFSLRVEGDIRATDSVQAWVTVLEADVAAGDELTLSAVIEVRAAAVRREEAEMLTDAERCYKTAPRRAR